MRIKEVQLVMIEAGGLMFTVERPVERQYKYLSALFLFFERVGILLLSEIGGILFTFSRKIMKPL